MKKLTYLLVLWGHVRYSLKVRDLLNKVDSLMDRELNCEDYSRCIQIEIEKNKVTETTIEFN